VRWRVFVQPPDRCDSADTVSTFSLLISKGNTCVNSKELFTVEKDTGAAFNCPTALRSSFSSMHFAHVVVVCITSGITNFISE
jgi:hypothetical protein